MARKLKVYGWTGFYPLAFMQAAREAGAKKAQGGARNCGFAMAAPTKAEVYRVTGKKSWDHYQVYETGNEDAITAAMSKPGAVFFRDEIHHTPGENVWLELTEEEVER